MLRTLQHGDIRPLEVGDTVLPQHVDTLYINVTKLCQSSGKTFGNWRRLDSAQNIINEVSKMTGMEETELIVSILTGPNHRRGTWMDHRLACALAVWIDPMFVVFLAEKVKTPETNEDRQTERTSTEYWKERLQTTEYAATLLEKFGGMEACDRASIRDQIRAINKRMNECIQRQATHGDPFDKIDDTTYLRLRNTSGAIHNRHVSDPDTVRTLALAVAMRLGHRPMVFLRRLKCCIASHERNDMLNGRMRSDSPTVSPEQVAMLLRAQSFRCLECDVVMSLTNTMADDAHAFSLGRIWNDLPHSFANICVICRMHNQGSLELRSLRRLIQSDPTLDQFKIDMNNGNTTKGRNLVIEALAPDLVTCGEDHVQIVNEWVENHEGTPDDQLIAACNTLASAGLGRTKRELLEQLADERAMRFKRQRNS